MPPAPRHSPRQRARTACEAVPPQDFAPPRKRRATRRLAPHPRRRCRTASTQLTNEQVPPRSAAAKPPRRARAAAATRHRPSARRVRHCCCKRRPQCQRRESLRHGLHRRIPSRAARAHAAASRRARAAVVARHVASAPSLCCVHVKTRLPQPAAAAAAPATHPPSRWALRSAARCTCRCDTAEARRPRSSRPTLWRRQQLCTSAAALCVPLRMQLRTAAAALRTLRGRAPRCAAGCRVVRGRACAAAAAARTRAQHPAARYPARAAAKRNSPARACTLTQPALRARSRLLSGAGTSHKKMLYSHDWCFTQESAVFSQTNLGHDF